MKRAESQEKNIVVTSEFSLSQFRLGHTNNHKCEGCGCKISYRAKSGFCRDCNLQRAREIYERKRQARAKN